MGGLLAGPAALGLLTNWLLLSCVSPPPTGTATTLLPADPDSYGYLTGVLVLSSLGGFALVMGIVLWIRHRGLMFIPAVV